MSSHERIGRALNSHNLRSDEHHSDADVVAALAFAPQLGASLQLLISAGHTEEVGRTIEYLTLTLVRAGRRKRIGFGKMRAETIARQALLEWTIRVCRACNGTGSKLVSYSHDAAPVKANDSCDLCDGTGMFLPLWEWRAVLMDINDQDPAREWWEKRIELAKEIIEDAFSTARRRVTAQLAE